jgi:hypothetical protein
VWESVYCVGECLLCGRVFTVWESVYCEIRTESRNTIQINISLENFGASCPLVKTQVT